MKHFDNIYFMGIGGIGMSALARYFLHEGKAVAGYDRTETPLTRELEREGAVVTYEDEVENIPEVFRNPDTTMVVFTPAVPEEHPQMQFFRNGGFLIEKRSQMLGHLSEGKYVMAVAGTHGKTTTSTLIAWLNHATQADGSAFLGGISKNFGGNLVLGASNRLAVEADEFDRSFLRLRPDVAVITAVAADHLDIYGTFEAVVEAFGQFAALIKEGGHLILKKGVEIALPDEGVSIWRYSYDEECDFYADRIRLCEGGYYNYDIVTPDSRIEDCRLGIPGWVNIENSVAAVAAMWCAAKSRGEELNIDLLRKGLSEYSGVKRRFEFYINTPRQVYMDDYAHHPEELEAAITSVRKMFPTRHLTAIFQPHLYTRTRDLFKEFAAALSHADEAILVPIYPAREEPIEGISSEMIAKRVTIPCSICEREHLAEYLEGKQTDVVVSFGAGNIDAYCGAIAAVLQQKA
ncbi:MAG: UDP-N-acetylmuramate--L-alanine ligase [Alistipes sp.]|nr:UDP-N-acetylmuramate--L-alanine ligase [Alistipes sp.]